MFPRKLLLLIIDFLFKNKATVLAPAGSPISNTKIILVYVELQHVTDTGQKSDRQKVAMRPNGWLCKIILPAISLF